MILVQLQKVDSALPNLVDNLCGQQLLYRFHEGGLAIAPLRSSLRCPVVESFGHWIRRNHLLHVMPEFTKQFVVETGRPVLTQELHDIWNESIIVPFAYLIQVLIRQTHEGHKGRHHHLLTA